VGAVHRHEGGTTLRKIIVSTLVTADGIDEDPGGMTGSGMAVGQTGISTKGPETIT